MELIINYPTDDEGIKLFESKFAEFQSLLIMKCIDDLNIDSTSKKKLLLEIAEEVRVRINNSENNNKNKIGN